MFAALSHCQPFSRSLAGLALLALGGGLSGCAEMGDSMTSAFADPAKYDLYDCKQLETERKVLANRAAEFQGLMAKALIGLRARESTSGGTRMSRAKTPRATAAKSRGRDPTAAPMPRSDRVIAPMSGWPSGRIIGAEGRRREALTHRAEKNHPSPLRLELPPSPG